MIQNDDNLTRARLWQIENAYQNRYSKALLVTKYLLLHILPALLVMLYAWLSPSPLWNFQTFALLSTGYLVLALGALHLYYHYAGGNGCYNVRYELRGTQLRQTYWLEPLSDKIKLAFRCYQVLFAILMIAALLTTMILARLYSIYPLCLAALILYSLALIHNFNCQRIEKEQEKVIQLNQAEQWWFTTSPNYLRAKLINRKLNKQMVVTFNNAQALNQFEHLLQEQYPQVRAIKSTFMRWLAS